MADFFFDLGLEDQLAGYTKGSCWSTVSQYPARDKVPQLLEPGKGLSNMSKEELLSTGCDFLIGWDSVFSDKNFSKEFCDQNGIATYFPYVCSDKATFEDLYKDYETLGAIFQVQDVAAEKVQAMKDTLQKVKEHFGMMKLMKIRSLYSLMTLVKMLRLPHARVCRATSSNWRRNLHLR